MTEYRMDAPHAPTAFDRGVQGLIGKGIDRIDGPAKVTGAATYAAEFRFDRPIAYGVAITATIAAGTVATIDKAAAEAMPGVLAIITDDPRLPRESPLIRVERMNRVEGTLESYGEIVGVAIADSFEEARAAAKAVVVTCVADDGRFDMMTDVAEAKGPPKGAMLPDVVLGDVDAAMHDAAATIDVVYTTPRQVHAAMEPHAAIADWDGDACTLYGSIQLFGFAQGMIAGSLDIPRDKLRLVSPYIGGGFGGKIGGPETVLAAIGAQATGRPVKVALTRQQIFHSVYGRSDTHQHLRLAATKDGVLTAIAQDSIVSQKADGGFFEPVALGSVGLYSAPNRSFTTKIVTLNLTPTGAVRAPGEAVGMIGLECAMDELAERLGLDPVVLRKRNEPATDPTSGKPFSSRRLIDCFDEGEARFGWASREKRRDGEWLIGHGMATAARVNFLADSAARVRLSADGAATIETDMTDIGTGTYTILAQVAGESLGLPIDRISVKLGDSDFPTGAGSGGSFGAASSTSSVVLACEDIVAELARRMDTNPEDMTLKDGHAIAGNRRISPAELVGDAPIEAIGTIHPGKNNQTFSQATHGAQFAEVGVNAVTGEVRVRRMLGVFDCGRILNAKTARSQAIGGMIWGIGYALHEHAVVDARSGAYVNRDFGEYHIPVNADVPQIEAYFVEEIDRHANPVGAKGIGELGISGAAAAIANAIHDACGVRVRNFPITPDTLLAGLPPL